MNELTYKALLVCNGIFPDDPHNLPELKGPQNDLQILERTLIHPQVGIFDPANVETLLDCTKNEIMVRINMFFDTAKRDDQLLFYYSGHGRLDKYNNFYICTRDTQTNALIPTAISDQVLNSMINQSISNRIIIIIDACHSGRFKGGAMSEHLHGEGRFVLTSSRAKELSGDADEANKPSTFTGYLVNALLSSEVDSNKDGFISINEAYDYIYPRILEETKQRPHRIFDKTTGEVALGRSVGHEPSQASQNQLQSQDQMTKPMLNVSCTQIDIRDIEPNEELPEEIIDVFNEGGGTLKWTVECSDNWMEIDKQKNHFKVRLHPNPGVNRGRIYVRDADSGRAKRITVHANVLTVIEKPKIKLSETRIDFGTVNLNAPQPIHTIRLFNVGGGQLDVQAKSHDDWIKEQVLGDILEIKVDTGKTGNFNGIVKIHSDGGNVDIPISLNVEAGPLLHINPSTINFSTVNQGAAGEESLEITNRGSGNLTWKFRKKGSFFAVDKQTNGLLVVLNSRKIGKHQGSIFITSNGGEQTVAIRANVIAPPPPLKPPEPQPPRFADISGSWTYNGGGVQFIGSGSNYQFQGANVMGVVVEQGTATVQGNTVKLVGQNILTGPMLATFNVQSDMMVGQVMSGGVTLPLVLKKATGNPFTNFLQSLF